MPHDPVQNPLGQPFIELQSVDSTNNYAFEQIHAGLTHHGAAFFAHEQVAGKGQRGKIWIAERDSNLILSVVVQPHNHSPLHQFHLNACIALSVCEFFSRYAGTENTKIKWPNDLYWQDRKAGGVLIESSVGSGATGSRQSAMMQPPPDRQGDGNRPIAAGTVWQWAVIGIGININQLSFPSELKNAVSLAQITGKKFNTVDLAKELCRVIDEKYALLCQDGFGKIYEEYLKHLYKRGQAVRFKKDTRNFEAIVKTVSPEGRLVLQHAMEEEFSTGQIEWKNP